MEKNENWQRIKAIVAEALERAPQERETFLSEACAADPLVRAEVKSLLSAYESSLGLSDTELIAQLVDAAQIKTRRAILSGQQARRRLCYRPRPDTI